MCSFCTLTHSMKARRDQVEQVVDHRPARCTSTGRAAPGRTSARRVERTLHVGQPDRQVALARRVVDRRQDTRHPPGAARVGQAQARDVPAEWMHGPATAGIAARSRREMRISQPNAEARTPVPNQGMK